MTGNALKITARAALILGAAILLEACTGSYSADEGGLHIDPDSLVLEVSPGTVVVVGSREAQRYNIPPGHLPAPGSCRVWFPGRPPGHQPPPTSCRVRVPRGAVLIRG